MPNNTPLHMFERRVYISRADGRTTTVPPNQLQLRDSSGGSNAISQLEHLNECQFGTFRSPVIHTYRNRLTGDVRSVSTRIHKSHGGYVSTRISKSNSSVDKLLSRKYKRSEIVRAYDGYEFRHKFQLLSTSPNEQNQFDGYENGSQEHGPDLHDVDSHHHVDHVDHGDQHESIINQSPAVAQVNQVITTKRFVRRRQRQQKFSEPQLLILALSTFFPRIGALSAESTSNPHIRVNHFFQRNRTFAFGTAYITSDSGPKALLTVLWQYQQRPRKAVCITFCIDTRHDTDTNDSAPSQESSENELLAASCTCRHLLRQTKGSEGSCYHTQVCFSDPDFVNFVSTEIRRRQDVPHLNDISDTIFGRCIDVDRLGELWYYLTVFLERPMRRGKKLARPWMFFMVLDVNMLIFVPVMKEDGKPFQCMLCRGSADRRLSCDHEDVCFRVCMKVRQDPRGHGLISDLAILDEEFPSESDSDEQEWINDGLHSRNGSVNLPEIYHPTSFKRSIMPCSGELGYMTDLAKRIDTLQPGDILEFDDRMTTSCPTCNTQNTKPRYEGYRRTVNIFTMGQGVVKVNVYDWFCDTCEQKRVFTGRFCGLFPARKESCYTTEMMYTLLEMTCMQGMTFRNAYKAIRLFSRLPSTLERLKTLSPTILGEDEKRSRRRTSEAFNFFLKHVDTSSPLLTSKLFSCENCENSLTSQDCQELGIPETEGRHLKRLNAVVIDGTAAGILTTLPSLEKHSLSLPVAKNGLGAVRLVRNATHYKTVRKLLDIAHQGLRIWKRKPHRAGRATTDVPSTENFGAGYMKFWITNPRTLRKLGEKNGVVAPKENMTLQETQIVQLLLDETACFCSTSSPEQQGQQQHGPHQDQQRQQQHGPQSQQQRQQQHGPHPEQQRQQQHGPQSEQQQQDNQQRQPHHSEQQQRERQQQNQGRQQQRPQQRARDEQEQIQNVEERHDQDPRHDESCQDVRCSFEEARGIPEIDKALQELFSVTEYCANDFSQSQDENTNNSREGDQVEPYVEDSDENSSHEEDNNDDDQQIDESETAFVASLRMPNINQSAKFAEAAIDLLRFLTIEHVALPYVGRVSVTPDVQSMASSSSSMVSFTSIHMHLHEVLIQAVEKYCDCLHFREGGNTHIVPPSCVCIENLKLATLSLNEASPILTTFCQELLRLRRPLHITQICTITALMDLATKHMEVGRAYFDTLETSLSDESKSYWHHHGQTINSTVHNQNEIEGRRLIASLEDESRLNANSSHAEHPAQHLESSPMDEDGFHSHNHTPMDLNEIINRLANIEMEDSLKTGICFPGRVSSRPSIIFNTKDKQNCTKKYNVSRSHTPGLLTLQCTCDSPKLIGVIVMTQAESVSLALSSILTNLGIPPRMVYYDNACNLFTSTLLRVPWLLGRTRFAVDRFHYKSHMCCAYFNPDSYYKLDMQRTETAESINARIETTLTSLRYMRGDKIIPFLRSRFSLMNLAATFKQKYLRSDLEDEDMTKFFNELYACTCKACEQLKIVEEQKAQLEREGTDTQ